MPRASKLKALQRRFRSQATATRAALPKPARRTKSKRVQKNLTIDERDAHRLKRLAATAKISQAKLLTRALDAYEKSQQETS
ncbi:MAG: hypothetical protein AAGC70_19195 [Pseudomonadota bacterium]